MPFDFDIVMCIDGTSDMHGIIDQIKATAKRVYPLFTVAAAERGRSLNSFRIRVIVFRDYDCDGEDAMVQSRFFDMTTRDGEDAFADFVNSIDASGGGDPPESALEAIALALRSDWNTTPNRYRRQIVMLFTDAPCVELHDPRRTSNPLYPQDMPADLSALHDLFVEGDAAHAPCYSPRHGRLLVCSPEHESWNFLCSWERALWVPTEMYCGCRDVNLEAVLHLASVC